MADWAISDQPNELTAPADDDLLRIHDDSDSAQGEKKIKMSNLLAYPGKVLAVSASSDALDVSGVSVVKVDTSGGSVVIGGLSNGVDGQRVKFIHNVKGNTLTLEDEEGTGDEKIHTIAGTDLAFTDYGGCELYFNGTRWIQVG